MFSGKKEMNRKFDLVGGSRFPIIAACSHARRKPSRTTMPKVSNYKYCAFDRCQANTRFSGIYLPPFNPTKRYHGDILQFLYAQVPMCIDCFEFASWHVKHKWNILALLSRAFPQISRNAWSVIESFTWIR